MLKVKHSSRLHNNLEECLPHILLLYILIPPMQRPCELSLQCRVRHAYYLISNHSKTTLVFAHRLRKQLLSLLALLSYQQ